MKRVVERDSLSRSALYEQAHGDHGMPHGGKSSGPYFLTLCAVPAPIPVPEPKSPALQRFRFFFTRQRLDGHERCWLHFGHFRTADEARKWREVLLRVYPQAVIAQIPETASLPIARRKPTLEDTLDELRDTAWQGLETEEDPLSSTGVRHLRVEVEKKPRAAANPTAGRRARREG
jgi:hypothetical protein